MSLKNQNPEEQAGDNKGSVNPFANTHNKNTQVQNPSRNNVSQNGNVSGANVGKDVNKTVNIRNNPQGNRPMSVDGSQKGPGKQGD